MNNKDFSLLLTILLKKVMIVPTEILDSYKEIAYNIVKDIDPDDTLFIACALAYHDSIVWSDDKKLKQQSKIKIINTQEMINILYGTNTKQKLK